MSSKSSSKKTSSSSGSGSGSVRFRSQSLTVEEISEINGPKLPSNGQVIGYFLFLHRTERDIQTVAKLVFHEVKRFYDNAQIRVRDERNSIKRIKSFYYKYHELKKGIDRNRPLSSKTKTDIRNFSSTQDDFFDISHNDALDTLDDKTKQFLLSQRLPGREGTMDNISERHPGPSFGNLSVVREEEVLKKTTEKESPLPSEIWAAIDESKYQPGIMVASLSKSLKPIKQEIEAFAYIQMRKDICRSDYREFLELVLLFLGAHVDRRKESTNLFHLPGPDHHARWMSKAIYALKIFLFRDQFQMTASEQFGLEHVCSFIVKYYVKLWFGSPSAAKAPVQDLNFLKAMINDYKTVNEN
ncbi:hypothetical protein Bhyg_12134 [Pseudolycoriella hygida]|uniref:Uncharacterized protein n=1 Tax=Pseudolycoriella hygida TaxID=35572 RepID=A0A9Q0RZ04_9DIPT|nr:hypothetical protein Bhyg_12134 [Pseudolycoriella hygida]